MASNASNAPTAIPQGPRPGKKYFTLGEANRSLPYVTRVVEDLTISYGRVVEIRQNLATLNPNDNRETLENELEAGMDRLSELVDELQQVGVELKDFEKGLLDFPSLHEGREIYLCWHRGEKAVHTWHEIDAGYAGRQDVAALEQH